MTFRTDFVRRRTIDRLEDRLEHFDPNWCTLDCSGDLGDFPTRPAYPLDGAYSRELGWEEPRTRTRRPGLEIQNSMYNIVAKSLS